MSETHVFPSDDARLDWRSQHDERSRVYPIRTLVGAVDERPRTWRTGDVLDQGSEGACVGFGWTAELLASPRPDPYTTAERANEYALALYRRAQQLDAWEGESYDGTSVLAGALAVRERGLIDEFRWCFSVEDVRDAVIASGPVVIGIPWHSQMYGTRASGLVEVGGSLVGGHCIVITGYHPSMRIPGEDYHARFRVFRWRNSWSSSYGVNGDGFIRYEDLRDLLAEHGEACVPMKRSLVRLS